MAPALTSKSFLLTTSTHSKLTLNNSRFTVFAKRAGLRLGKSGGDDSSEERNQPDGSTNFNPFRFNFGKIPDVTSLIPVVSNPSSGLSFGNQRRKDPNTVFVAGATGQAGIRIAQTLLRQGFSVRAGVSEIGAAQELARLAADYKIISNEEAKRLNAVESTFQDVESIAKAISNASKVVVTIGPAENGPTSEVSTSDALQVVRAAQLVGVGHVAIVYDGSNSNTTGSSTYKVLDGISSFFNNLFSRSQPLTIAEFLQNLIETDVSYTFIKTSLTEDFSPESAYNVVVSGEGSSGANDYKVAKFQIASLVADVFSNTEVAENKVVEVYTDPAAPLSRIDEVFSGIPEDGRRKAYAESLQQAKAEEEARIAAEKAREAAEAAKELEKQVKKLSEQEARAASLANEAQEKAEAAGTSVGSLLDKAKDFGTRLPSWEEFSSQIGNTVQVKPLEKPKVQITTVRGQAKARRLLPKKAVVKQSTPNSPSVKAKEEKPKPKEKPTEVRKVFGGLFTQETVYVDDD
ncbi:protein plastid transcriptionally active 16, chloroplastic [Quillaja saponaria]|uniref:Protein plastid transcriptionally active 16, chloroplastic n=1 Tax=Quillaja saponaria TaxID=32244 RepID=A0AAD7KXI0_QUISA|nr:protein plastid transcriptionally active 16, chloroplastic [Quillaja saponaria]